AARLVLELKDKAPALGGVDFGGAGADSAPKLPEAAEDAMLALVGLGYARPQAAAAVARCSAHLGSEAQTATLIRAALKDLAQ
ncbi:MAG: Holliday junction branch migration protein RuvA, partial [Hyphomicrobiales bacterium]|nr:Holliday junction branch migration protein RuvA [Hyphomicrobiales bacterium]